MAEVPSVPRATPMRMAALAVPAAILAVILGIFEPAALASGFLVAWVTCLSACIGAGVWLLIAQLTGGVWPLAGGATLPALSRMTPLVAVLGPIVFLCGPILYPWWHESEGLRGEIYLVPWSFGLRGAVMLALWALIGWLAPRRPGAPVSALLLTGYGITVGIAGLDWILSRDPHMLSTAFGMLLAAMQLGLALAVCAIRGLDTATPRAVADWGGLMLATCLGTFYLSAMQFLVSWSGNLPYKAEWFGARTDGIGTFVIVAAFLLGILLPFGTLIATHRRGSARALRAVGGSMAAAVFLHMLWLTEGGGMHVALVAAAAVLGAVAGLIWPLLERRAGNG
ncbi:hypothetical protein [Roseivivax sediminis]|uniref:Uncharacterized protein n=1 Tax=Roseivivax sediminis TaxID=936889 RepID=A0A1I1X3V0_9RHOB|nr:hypothetical protein [Roseivivax sediminis]SFE02032.1 hypothetical protein SAMN04515678_105223 [Roseivivax sediminis]